MTLENRIQLFVALGDGIRQDILELNDNGTFKVILDKAVAVNAWFTKDNVLKAFNAIANQLTYEGLKNFLTSFYSKFDANKTPKTIGVVMAGNVPLVGFHDALCVLLSGNKLLAKVASDDAVLMGYIHDKMVKINPEIKKYFTITASQLKDIDAVIATGSNNTARYFEYYFSKYPHIIRKNRNSVAVLNGKETTEQLSLLGNDIFQYFGLGCRNVSKLLVPVNYNFDHFFKGIYAYETIIQHHKYYNNYMYNRTINLMNGDKTLLDNNFLLLKQDATYTSAIGVLHYEYYRDMEEVKIQLNNDASQIQCVVSETLGIQHSTAFGSAQQPSLTDFADGVNTLEFLTKI